MAWIQTLAPAEAEGELRREYDAAVRRAGKVYQILRVQSLNPAALRDGIRLYVTLMHATSELSRSQREMLAVAVSAINRCRY